MFLSFQCYGAYAQIGQLKLTSISLLLKLSVNTYGTIVLLCDSDCTVIIRLASCNAVCGFMSCM